MNKRMAVVAAAAVAIALGAWAYSLYTTHANRTAIVAFVKDAGEKLRPALRADEDERRDFDASQRAVDTHLLRLRAMSPSSSLIALADAADAYLLSAREILRQRARIQSSRAALDESLAALSRHRATDRGAAGWVRQAVALKENVDRDLRALRIASESYASLLHSLPQAQGALAEHVNRAWLADEKSIAAARGSALDALARTDENTKQATRLDPARGAAARR